MKTLEQDKGHLREETSCLALRQASIPTCWWLTAFLTYHVYLPGSGFDLPLTLK